MSEQVKSRCDKCGRSLEAGFVRCMECANQMLILGPGQKEMPKP